MTDTQAGAAQAVAWPTMPLSKGQSSVLFEDGYAEGWAKCLAACKEALAATQPSAAPGDGQGALVWSGEEQPVANGCRYNHVTAETPFGRILISWKGWKDRPRFDIDEHPAGAGPSLGETLEEAKQEAQRKYSNALSAALAAGSMQVASVASAEGYCSYCQLKGHEEEDCEIAKNVKAGGDCSVIFGVLKDGERDPYPLFLDSEGYKARDFVKEHGGRIVEYLAAPSTAIAAREQEQSSGWRDIRTVPDGDEEFLVGGFDDNGKFHQAVSHNENPAVNSWRGWNHRNGPLDVWATHWKPLDEPSREEAPAAPTSQPNAAAQEQQAGWEDATERYLADIIDRAPEPLRRLGEWLSQKLDEDEWKSAERYVLGAMEARGWMSIESAPKDESKFLAYKRGTVATASVLVRDDGEIWTFGRSSAHADVFPGIVPSHWMPLPPAPTGTGSVGLPSGRGEDSPK